MKNHWIVKVLFIFVLLKTIYRLSPNSPDHKIFWTVFYFIPEYCITLSAFIKLYMSELDKQIRFIYGVFTSLYIFSISYLLYSAITSKTYTEFQDRENNPFFSIIDIVILSITLFIVITPKKR